MEDTFPGMWQRWFLNQCVAVGWAADWGYRTDGKPASRVWARARNTLSKIQIGDAIIVALQDNTVGRIGFVTGLTWQDTNWRPLVPRSKQYPDGEMGRRVEVRWDLTTGPMDRSVVVQLPEGFRFNAGESRQAIGQVRTHPLEDFQQAMNDEANWVGIQTKFKHESALQAYIYTYPHHLEDGFSVHPDLKVREKVFDDRKRADVLLIDREENAVVVECKRDAPSVSAVHQLRHYMSKLKEETRKQPRGILVHGGSRKLSDAVRQEANRSPVVQIVRYDLKVDFDLCL